MSTSQLTMGSTDQQQHSFSNEADKDGFLIILENLDEVGPIVHSHHSYMEMKQEGPNHFILYLRNNEKLYEIVALKAVENYVEKKKIDKMCQQASEKYMISSNNSEWSHVDNESENPDILEEIQEQVASMLISPEKQNRMKQDNNRFEEIMIKQQKEFEEQQTVWKLQDEERQKKVEEYETKMKEQEYKLEEYIKKTGELERKIEEQHKEMDKCQQHLKIMAARMEVEIKKRLLEPISLDSNFHGFLNEKYFDITLKSTVVLNGLANRLHKKEEGDCEYLSPPLKHIDSLEQRRKEVIDYIEFMRINWNNADSGTVVQQNIHNWFCANIQKFLFNPSDEEKEESRKMFLNKFKLENTIGTLHFLPIQLKHYTLYFCLAISNYRIVYCCWGISEQQDYAYYMMCNNLKRERTWTRNSKFATDMEVDEYYSDSFIHTSNKEVFIENEKVVTWIKNNFNMGQRNSLCSRLHEIIPPLYNCIFDLYNP